MDSYNSQYPLEYYEIGTPYMFYLATGPKNCEAATMEQINEYSSAIKRAAKGNKSVKEGKNGDCFAKRYIGVVIGKEVISPNTSIINVLFQGTANGQTVYITKKYIVGHSGVFCDDKEQFEPAENVDLTGEVNVTAVNGKNGGVVPITHPKNGGVVPIANSKSGGVVPMIK